MSAKVQLDPPKKNPYATYPKGVLAIAVRSMLPFYKSVQSAITHRVRSAEQHWRDGGYSHTSIRFLCQGTGFLSNKGRHSENRISATPLSKLCERCEAEMIRRRLPCPK